MRWFLPRHRAPIIMSRLFLCAVLAALVLHASDADILWQNCVGLADVGNENVKRGHFYNLCIKKHTFGAESHAWQFVESNLFDTEFKACTFANDKTHSVNFTLAKFDKVKFTKCLFGSKVAEQKPMLLENTVLRDVLFSECTFDKSATLQFSRFDMNNVTFNGCIFESDTIFQLGRMQTVKFENCKFQRSPSAKVRSSGKEVRLDRVRTRAVSFTDSEFLAPLFMQDVNAADMHFNKTKFAEFWCHSKPDKSGKVKSSAFNDSLFNEVTFKEKVNCGKTTWRGFSMFDSKFNADAIFSKSKIQDIYWDGVEVDGSNFKGKCSTLDLSESTLFRNTFANVTARCELDLTKTRITIVRFKNVKANVVRLKSALFKDQERIDDLCCTKICKDNECSCDYKRPPKPSDKCPTAPYPIDMNAPQSCFPARSTVRTESGVAVQMSDLQHGERIAVGSGQHSDVFFFGHRSRAATAEFVEISHSGVESPLLISPGHYLYVNGRLSTAESVRPGDILSDADGFQIFAFSVKRIQDVGVYAPASLDGDLIVNGVRVSSYTSALHPTLAHWLLSPLRLAYNAGFRGAVERITFMHERGMEHVARKLWLPEGPKVVEV